MIRRKNIYLFALVLLFGACKNTSKDEGQKQYIYYDSGAVRREFFLVDGKREGLMTDFYPTGKKRAERIMLHDIQVGKTTMYHEDGISVREIQYFDNQGNRIQGDTLWYTNGNIEFTADFAHDKKNGLMSRYDTTGVLLYRAQFKDDSLIQVLHDVFSK